MIIQDIFISQMYDLGLSNPIHIGELHHDNHARVAIRDLTYMHLWTCSSYAHMPIEQDKLYMYIYGL